MRGGVGAGRGLEDDGAVGLVLPAKVAAVGRDLAQRHRGAVQ